MIPANINDYECEMLYDPGAAHSVVGQDLWMRIGGPTLSKKRNLVAYTDVEIDTLGVTEVNIPAFGLVKNYLCMSHDQMTYHCLVLIATNISNAISNTPIREVETLISRYGELFNGKIGSIRGSLVQIHLKHNTIPKTFRLRQQQVTAELDRLVMEDVLEPVNLNTDPIEWATPIVLAVKSNGSIRICRDFSVTVNPNVHPESRKLLVISKHRGYYQYKRLPFGVNFAPSVSQRTMDQILSRIDGTVDDILVTAPTKALHLQRLEQIFQRLQFAGIRTQQNKCKWFQKNVSFLGHVIDAEGLHPTTEYIAAIKNMPWPTNVNELRSLLGSITYCNRFIKHVHVICTPLYRHLKKESIFKWTTADEALFNKLKQILTSNDTLVHYDPNLPLVVISDASDKGAGAVLFHKYADDGMNHKALERIFSKERETPKIANNRLLRWAMILSSYDYETAYHAGKENAPADVLSRLQLTDKNMTFEEEVGLPKRGHLFNLRMHHLPVTKRKLQDATSSDKTLRAIIKYLQTYWPEKRQIPADLTTFDEKREELSFEERILLWQGRLCIPTSLRRDILEMLHDGHPGITAMQSYARLHVYWSKIDDDIVNFVKSCQLCQESKQNDSKLPLFPWNALPEPWARVNIDSVGSFENKLWLVIIDAYSRWLEVIPMKNITSTVTVNALHEVFSRLLYSKTIVSDNGPQLTSEEFEQFCKNNSITYICTTPYHPKTNGLAERVVKTFKETMTASGRDIPQHERLQKFLFSYRNTIQRSTGRGPSEILFGRPLRSAFHEIKPDIFHRMDSAKRIHDRGARDRVFVEHQPAWVKNPMGKGSSPEVGCPMDVEKATPTPPPPSIELTIKNGPAASIEKSRGIERPNERDQPVNHNPKPEVENRVESTPQHSPTPTLRRNPTRERCLPTRYRE
ncbi:hypothetical protein Trydic_g2227 [Trypoxylus dichotomus]